ncbi:hypothetical protein EDB19DRAFT_2045431 [Suillus lakei]|nr:hypothetical protein EDB19DRAFT_2045431 [Suillus lakei]
MPISITSTEEPLDLADRTAFFHDNVVVMEVDNLLAGWPTYTISFTPERPGPLKLILRLKDVSNFRSTEDDDSADEAEGTGKNSPPLPRTPPPSSPAHDNPHHPTEPAVPSTLPTRENSPPPPRTLLPSSPVRSVPRPRPIPRSTKPAVSSPLAARENLPAPSAALASRPLKDTTESELTTSNDEDKPQLKPKKRKAAPTKCGKGKSKAPVSIFVADQL